MQMTSVYLFLFILIKISFSYRSISMKSRHRQKAMTSSFTEIEFNRIQSDIESIKDPSAFSLLKSIRQERVFVPRNGLDVYSSYSYLPSINKSNAKKNLIKPTEYDNILSKLFGFLGGSILAGAEDQSDIPVVLIHGFDSSCFEFRKLQPLLNVNRDVYAVDILGWGFNDHSQVNDFSPESKISHLCEFLKTVVGGPCVLVGASLGGAIALIVAADYPELVKKVVLIDGQGFIDGNSKNSDLPDFIARIGIQVLKSKPLRRYANSISYYNAKEFATEDAMNIGRLHCLQDKWEDASINFLKSGGFVVSNKVSLVKQPTLIIWGANDKILDPSTAERYRQTLPNPTIVFIDECGHVPHIEKAEVTANEILTFLGNI